MFAHQKSLFRAAGRILGQLLYHQRTHAEAHCRLCTCVVRTAEGDYSAKDIGHQRDRALTYPNPLHTLRNLDAEESHTVLDDFGDIAGEDKAEGTLLLVGLVEDAVVMIELVEDLGELVAVVGNA